MPAHCRGASGRSASQVQWRVSRAPAELQAREQQSRRRRRDSCCWCNAAMASTTTTCLLGPLRAGRQQTRGAAAPPRTRARRSSRARVPRWTTSRSGRFASSAPAAPSSKRPEAMTVSAGPPEARSWRRWRLPGPARPANGRAAGAEVSNGPNVSSRRTRTSSDAESRRRCRSRSRSGSDGGACQVE